MLKGTRTAECLDLLFRDALKTHSTIEALQYVQRLEAADDEARRDCHPVVHAIGRETFLLKGSIHESFTACDQTCHSGCDHGSVERFLRGDSFYAGADQHPSQWELRHKAAAACDPTTPLRIRYQCLHGLGHAIMFFAAYNLNNALDVCDALADDWSQNSCYGGVFMESVVNSASEKRNFSATDYHAPCSGVAYALADDTWDGRYALPFCAALASAADQNDCFRDTRLYLRTFFDVSADGFAGECARYAPGSERCVASVGPRSSQSGAPDAPSGQQRPS